MRLSSSRHALQLILPCECTAWEGVRPLHLSAESLSLAACRELAECGADVKAKDSAGNSFEYYAGLGQAKGLAGHEEVMQWYREITGEVTAPAPPRKSLQGLMARALSKQLGHSVAGRDSTGSRRSSALTDAVEEAVEKVKRNSFGGVRERT